ncbi:MAG: NADH-quinone oxidoreductase subunit NuoH [Acidobacteria bacterium]|nr:MAG: NADH-quinone oxidoreductase subunit NuoH [Acidobacteriota bacterium]
MTIWIEVAVKTLALLLMIPLAALALGYSELKIMAHMQSRVGPMEAGKFHGWAQLIADGLKFIQKEDVIPEAADRSVFALAPVLSLISAFLVFAVVPFGSGQRFWFFNLDIGLFYALAVSAISVLGVLMAGWSSANKYSLMGGLRAAAQLMAYELPLVLAAVAVVIQAGTMSLVGIVEAQANFSILGIPVPYVVPQFAGFVIFVIASVAELSRTPFDMPMAESELITGPLTEYTGFRFLFFFMAEYAGMFALSAIAATIYLGGYWLPGVPDNIAPAVGPVALVAKTGLIAFFLIWIRSTYPRLREDQLQKFAWKVLIPISLVNILVTSIAVVFVSDVQG